MKRPGWTPAMQAWLDEAVSRMPEPTIRQLDIVKAEFRKVSLPHERPRAA